MTRAVTDDAAWRVPFIFRGGRDATFWVAARPSTWRNALIAGFAGTFLWGAAWSLPVAAVQPGPIGVLVTAAFAIVFGVTTGAIVGWFLSKADTVEKPFRHNLAVIRAELAAERPTPTSEVETDTHHLWHEHPTHDIEDPTHLFRSTP